ncbi:L-rhamnose mutarotase [Demequina maris]|uniref:L-rhamnose mutarotase n=1 Tax=Demequina maris TaxID=1638982 RepID=UPI000780AF8F|nr:L-rhamnose mutarotase [Demequina maris]
MRRVAQVIGLPAEHREEYERHHAAVWPGVLERLARSHVHNYSIYRHGELLFSYFEYTGDDYERDMQEIADDPETQRWWAVQMPLQRPLEDRADGEWWSTLPEVFHQD